MLEVGDHTEDNVKAMVLVNDAANNILIPVNQGTRVNSVAEGVQRLQCLGFAVGGLAGCDVVTELSQVARNMVGRGEIR